MKSVVVQPALVLEDSGDSARITNGSSTVRTPSMVELPIHVGSNKDSSTIYGWITNIQLAVARTLVRAGRTGSWNMPLGVISKYLPIVERCCRAFQLPKSAYLYLPDTTQLFSANSERCYMLYDKLTTNGWDLGCVVTEQTSMWTLKSVEQLTCCFKRSQKAKTLALILVVKVSGEQTIASALL